MARDIRGDRIAPTHGPTGRIFRVPFNAYGPGEMPEDEPGIAPWSPTSSRSACSWPQAPRCPIFGDGTQTRTLTHIDDIADGVVTAMALPAGLNEDFNISAGDERTVAGIAEIIGVPAGAIPRSSRWSTCRRSRSTWCAAGRASRRPGDSLAGRRQIGIEEGVAQTVEWLRETLDSAAA